MGQEKQTFPYTKELKAIAKGNKKSLQNIYKQEASYMLAFAFKVLHHYKFAEDAVVQTFTLIWENAQYFDETMPNPRGWIYTIFRFHLNNIIRKNYQALKENLKESSAVLGDVCTNLHAGVHNFVEPGSFYQVFEELPEDTQKALITTYFSAESLPDTATLLQMPLGQLKENLKLGLNYLAQRRDTLAFKHDHTVFIGEYVLGALSDSDQQEAHALLAEDPVAEKISFVWEEEFLHFLNQLILETPPDALWVRIKQLTTTEKDTHTDTQELADELQLTQDQTNAQGNWDKFLLTMRRCWISRNFWRFFSLGLVILMLALLIIRPLENPIRNAAVLSSTTQANQVGFIVKQTNKLFIQPVVHQKLDSKIRLQLWHRDSQGLTHPLGVVDSSQDTVFPRYNLLKTGDLLLISIEPAGPHLSNSITGQIIYQGLVAEF